MASLIVDGGELVVRLSGWERTAAFHGDVSVNDADSAVSTVRRATGR